MTDSGIWEGFVSDPLSQIKDPFHLLDLPRSALSQRKQVLSAVVKAQKRGVSAADAERAKSVITDPEALAENDLHLYREAPLSRLKITRADLHPDKRLSTHDKWFRELASGSTSVETLHCLALLWSHWAVHSGSETQKGQSRDGSRSPEHAQMWKWALALWSVVWGARHTLSVAWRHPPDLMDRALERYLDKLKSRLLAFPEHADLLTSEQHVIALMAQAKYTAPGFGFACGPMMLEHLGLTDRVRSEIRTRGGPAQAWAELRRLLSPHARLESLLAQGRWETALVEIERGLKSDPNHSDLRQLRLAALLLKAASFVSSKGIDAALALYEVILKEYPSESGPQEGIVQTILSDLPSGDDLRNLNKVLARMLRLAKFITHPPVKRQLETARGELLLTRARAKLDQAAAAAGLTPPNFDNAVESARAALVDVADAEAIGNPTAPGVKISVEALLSRFLLELGASKFIAAKEALRGAKFARTHVPMLRICLAALVEARDLIKGLVASLAKQRGRGPPGLAEAMASNGKVATNVAEAVALELVRLTPPGTELDDIMKSMDLLKVAGATKPTGRSLRIRLRSVADRSRQAAASGPPVDREIAIQTVEMASVLDANLPRLLANVAVEIANRVQTVLGPQHEAAIAAALHRLHRAQYGKCNFCSQPLNRYYEAQLPGVGQIKMCESCKTIVQGVLGQPLKPDCAQWLEFKRAVSIASEALVLEAEQPAKRAPGDGDPNYVRTVASSLQSAFAGMSAPRFCGRIRQLITAAFLTVVAVGIVAFQGRGTAATGSATTRAPSPRSTPSSTPSASSKAVQSPAGSPRLPQSVKPEAPRSPAPVGKDGAQSASPPPGLGATQPDLQALSKELERDLGRNEAGRKSMYAWACRSYRYLLSQAGQGKYTGPIPTQLDQVLLGKMAKKAKTTRDAIGKLFVEGRLRGWPDG